MPSQRPLSTPATSIPALLRLDILCRDTSPRPLLLLRRARQMAAITFNTCRTILATQALRHITRRQRILNRPHTASQANPTTQHPLFKERLPRAGLHRPLMPTPNL